MFFLVEWGIGTRKFVNQSRVTKVDTTVQIYHFLK